MTEQEILHIWEVGQGQHPIDLALTMLMIAFPGMSRNELAKLSIGQRDTALLMVRKQSFGMQLATLAFCPGCHQQVECTLNLDDMQLRPELVPNNPVQQIGIDGYELSFRLPNSEDLAAIVRQNAAASLGSLLLQRCILESCRDNVPVPAEALPECVIAALNAHMAECDPVAEIQLDLTCPACAYNWQILFDIVLFLWREISTQAKRLLREVHILAQAYGWREGDILSLSATRRQLYIDMVG